MLPYCDIAFTSMLKTLFPTDRGYTIVWGPPESARQLLSTGSIKNLEAHPAPSPTNTVGIPGIAVFRTAAPRDDRIHSLPKASYPGWPQGEFPPNQQQVSVRGQITPGDTISLLFSSADISGTTETVSYVIQANDQYTDILDGLANIINNDSVLTAAEITASSNYGILNIFSKLNSVNTLTISDSSPSDQTEKVLLQSNLSGLYSFTKFIPVRAEYTLTVVTESLSDMNFIESNLWFMEIYNAVTTTIQGNVFNWNFYANNDHEYSRDINQDTGRVTWYKMTCSYEIDSIWAEGLHVPTINQILTTYEDMTSGDPIVIDNVMTVINQSMDKFAPGR